MNDPKAKVLSSVERSQKAIGRMDAALARDVVRAYGAARKLLIADLVEAFERLGESPTPAQVRMLLSNQSLIRAIERRIEALDGEFKRVMEKGMRGVTSRSYLAVSAEIGILAQALGIDEFFVMGLDPLLELTIAPAVAQVPGLTDGLKKQLVAALRVQLAQGARMDEIVRVLYGKGRDTGIFQRNLVSARRMAHRAVSEAENTARTAFLEQAQAYLPQLQRQAVSRVDGKTTSTCLRVHGQIVGVDKPFKLTGEKRLAREQMVPPFHWGPCRTSVVGYLPQFEQRSTMTTDGMRAQAAAQLRSRR